MQKVNQMAHNKLKFIKYVLAGHNVTQTQNTISVTHMTNAIKNYSSIMCITDNKNNKQLLER